MSGPIVGRRRLRAELRRMRRERELTQDLVAAEMEWSLSKLIRIENGTVAISVSDLRSLLAYYRVHDPATVDALLTLARAAKQKGAGLEAEAVRIGQFAPVMFPALLRTRRYADATSTDEREVDLLMAQQAAVLGRDDPPELQVVLDDSVLRRSPAPSDETLLVDQLEHAIDLAQRPNVDIRVLPPGTGWHPGWEGGFTLLDFGADDGVLYRQDVLHEEPELVAGHRELLDRLVERALNREDTLDLMRQSTKGQSFS